MFGFCQFLLGILFGLSVNFRMDSVCLSAGLLSKDECGCNGFGVHG
jgi:hypothetical protein